MSTPVSHVANGIVQKQREHGDEYDPRPLPVFSSIRVDRTRRLSHAGSSASSSKRSDVGSDNHNAMKWEDAKKTADELQNGRPTHGGTVRRRNGGLGGFLLESSVKRPDVSRKLFFGDDKKGKRKNEDASQSFSKRRLGDDVRDQSSSLKSSPLSVELKPDASTNNNEFEYISGPKKQNYKDLSLGSSATSSLQPRATSVGFDTDPAQIVEMALRLSEGRRRQTSSKRYASGEPHGRRVISTASTLPPRVMTPTQNHLRPASSQHQYRLNETVSPLATPSSSRTKDPVTSETQIAETSSRAMEEVGDEDMQISRATAKRVQKAKIYLELAYEHRRLLPHLPPIRTPSSNLRTYKHIPDGKAYNPLQYVRNRKLRFRERNPIDSEGDGWRDVHKVRTWVDAVADSDASPRQDPDECVRLPPLSLQELIAGDEDEADNGNQPQHQNSDFHAQKSKPKRPRSDWTTHPGDLIADAYWLEQGLNKLKIYDRENEAIYPPTTQFKFSGWRYRTPGVLPPNLQQPTPPPEHSPEAEPKSAVSALPDLPTFESAHKDNSWIKKKSKFKKALAKHDKSTKPKGLGIFESSSDSSSITSSDEDERKPRPLKRKLRKRERFDMPEGDPFSESSRGRHEAVGKHHRHRSSGIDRSASSSKRGSIDRTKVFRRVNVGGNRKTSPHDSNKRGRSARKHEDPLSTHNRLDYDLPRSSFESTAPSSPVTYGFPSIAINLSPAQSRSPSPIKRERSSLLHTVKDSVKDKIQTSRERPGADDFFHDQVERNDFANAFAKYSSRETSSGKKRRSGTSSKNTSRPVSPTSRGPSPRASRQDSMPHEELSTAGSLHRGSTVSKVSSKTTDSGSYRIRGMFKGGRIAELVGNEVNRVGDYIWKREPPKIATSTEEGSSSGYESDSEEDTKLARQSTTTPPMRAVPTSPIIGNKNLSSISPQSPKPTSKEHPQFHIQGLPSFTSPFQRDREEQDRKNMPQSPGGTLLCPNDIDHISRLAAEHRSASRSPRLDKLAPPKLNIIGTDGSDSNARLDGYGFGSALDLSRTQSASEQFTKMIGGKREDMIDALTGRSPETSHSAQQEDSTSKPKTERVALHEVERTRSLLVITAVKATNIAEYVESVPHPQSKFLIDSLPASDDFEAWKSLQPLKPNQPLQVTRREEHIFAARSHMTRLTQYSNTFNSKLDHFSGSAVQNLHRQLQILEDRVEQELTPRVRVAADSAGELSQRLNTTSTLAVKAVNDQISDAQKFRRRGPVRWIRLLNYAVIEWLVVGLLWLIWFVVTIIRTVLGTINGGIRIFKWLLWID